MNIILDIDGTLWNTTEIVAIAWNDAIEDVGLLPTLGRFITASMLQKEFGKPMDTIIDDLFPGQPSDKKKEILEVVKFHEKKAIEGCTAELAYDGVQATLRELVAKKNHLFIVSNCQEGYIELVMSVLGIEDYIDDFESFGATGLMKDENIRLVMNRNRFANGDTYYVGDTLGDYLAATTAGIPFIYASYGFGEMEPDYDGLAISGFDELLDMF